MRKVDGITYTIPQEQKHIGIKKLCLDVYEKDDINPKELFLRVSIKTTKIREISEKYALLNEREMYDFISILEKSIFYSNLIYTFRYEPGSQGGVKALTIRIDERQQDSKDSNKQKSLHVGVIVLAFFSPINNKNLNEKDRESIFFYLEPIQFVSVATRLKEILVAYRTSQYFLNMLAKKE